MGQVARPVAFDVMRKLRAIGANVKHPGMRADPQGAIRRAQQQPDKGIARDGRAIRCGHAGPCQLTRFAPLQAMVAHGDDDARWL